MIESTGHSVQPKPLVTLYWRRTAKTLFFLTVLVVLLGIVARVHQGWTGEPLIWIDVYYERNLPTVYSSGLLLTASFLAIWIALDVNVAKSKQNLFWALAGVTFAYMACDEFFEFHEELAKIVPEWVSSFPPLLFRWVAAGIVLVLGMTLLFLPLLRHVPKPTVIWLVAAGTVYFSGAIGFEMAAAYLSAVIHPRIDWAYFLLSFIEETLEMSGVVLVILALLRHVRDELGGRVTAWNRVVLSVT